MAKNNNLGDFLKSLADKFRLKLNTTAKINPQDFEGKIDEVYSKGKQEEYDKFWDNYQRSGNRTLYEYAFSYNGWNNETFKPKYDLTVDLSNCVNMFLYSRITGSLKTILNNLGVTLTFFHSTGTHNYGAKQIFMNTRFTELPELDFSQARGNTALVLAFSGSTLLQTIEKIILPDSCTGYGSNTFNNCRALQNINFEGTIKYSLNFKDCPLSADSMKNIFDHLDTNPAPDARTITIKQVVKNNYIAKYGETEWNNNVALYTGVLPGWSFTLV